MKRNFDEWIKNFRLGIAGYDYYVDFNKVYDNAKKNKLELNVLNSLIGSKNIEEEFRNIVTEYPKTLNCIPLLLAVRKTEIFIKDNKKEQVFNFKKMDGRVDDYVVFMRKSGLFDLLENHVINNLYDYVLGIEVGLDSNGRKNRGGHLMEDLVERYIIKAGFIKGETYFKEMELKTVEKTWNLDLSAMSGNNVSTKRFDFVLKTKNQVYVVETNFFGGKDGGSKLNETARSYKMLGQESKNVERLTFIWITDGTAWLSAKRNLNETFNELETIYNIADLESGVLETLK